MSKERNYGIDLLRLVLMYMVCMLHTLGQGGILGASVVGTRGHKVYWFLEILSYCAVNGFAIISGYMAVDKPRKYEKIVEMWFQAFFYSFVLTMILTIAGINESWERADMFRCALPVTFGKFWYFTAFFALFFSIPILNKYLFSIEENTAKKMFIIMVVFFSFSSIYGDPFKLSRGYSTIWLIVLYCIGALAKKIKLFETRKSITLIILWAFCIIYSWKLLIFGENDILKNYVSPTMLFSGIIMVVLFSRLPVKGRIISKLSPLAFGIYLCQLNQVVWNNIIKNAFISVVEKPLHIGVLWAFIFASVIFVSGLVVEFIRSNIAKIIRISLLSKRIVSLFDMAIERIFVLLK